MKMDTVKIFGVILELNHRANSPVTATATAEGHAQYSSEQQLLSIDDVLSIPAEGRSEQRKGIPQCEQQFCELMGLRWAVVQDFRP